MAKAKPAARRSIRCYLCGRRSEVSARTMSTTCPGCNKAIKVEDVVFALGANPVKGASSAKLTLVEFSDYQ